MSIQEITEYSRGPIPTFRGHADEICPAFLSEARVVQVGFRDPPNLAKTAAHEEETIEHYRQVSAEIREFIATELAKLL
jgi:arsenate reductase